MLKCADFVAIGGGAAGIFAALAAKNANPAANVIVLERTGSLLAKVKISGGGRCNVTHACFDPLQLVKNYPRGNKALIGPFTRFQPRDTVDWFASRGVELNTEADGRMFPITNTSQTIIDCLLNEAKKLNVDIRLKQKINKIDHDGEYFQIHLETGDVLRCKKVLLATGSHPLGHEIAKSFGHTIQNLVPSLFTFNVPSSPLVDLSGISVPKVTLSILESSFSQQGPLLITHWGFSGPAALKLSAWAARFLYDKNYQVKLCIDWAPDLSKEQVMTTLMHARKSFPSQTLITYNPFDLPKKLWKRLVELCQVDEKKRLSELSNDALNRLLHQLKMSSYQVDGKTTNKEEFVTCGGVNLDEVNFKTMESRLCKGVFFAGEVLDIDAVTGGFNFQNAWTTAWIAGQSIADE